MKSVKDKQKVTDEIKTENPELTQEQKKELVSKLNAELVEERKKKFEAGYQALVKETGCEIRGIVSFVEGSNGAVKQVVFQKIIDIV